MQNYYEPSNKLIWRQTYDASPHWLKDIYLQGARCYYELGISRIPYIKKFDGKSQEDYLDGMIGDCQDMIIELDKMIQLITLPVARFNYPDSLSETSYLSN